MESKFKPPYTNSPPRTNLISEIEGQNGFDVKAHGNYLNLVSFTKWLMGTNKNGQLPSMLDKNK